MPHKITWLVDQRVIYTHFQGNITQPDLERFMTNILVEIKTGTPMVHHISNSLEMGKVEVSLKTFQTLIGGYKMVNALGWNIDINRNPINKMFASISSQFARARLRTFGTMDEAIAFLREHDDTLAGLHWKMDILASNDRPLNRVGE